MIAFIFSNIILVQAAPYKSVSVCIEDPLFNSCVSGAPIGCSQLFQDSGGSGDFCNPGGGGGNGTFDLNYTTNFQGGVILDNEVIFFNGGSDISTAAIIANRVDFNIDEILDFVIGINTVSNRDFNITLVSGAEGQSMFQIVDRNNIPMIQIKDSVILANKSIIPASDDDFSLGNSSEQWNELHVGDILPDTISGYYSASCAPNFVVDIADDGTFDCVVANLSLLPGEHWLNDSGDNATGPIDFNNNSILGLFNIVFEDGTEISIGSPAGFSGMDNAFVISSNQTLGPGVITHCLVDQQGGRIIACWQSGRNNSGFYFRNSGGIFPDNGITNASILTNMVEMWNIYGVNSFLDYFSLENRTSFASLYALESQRLYLHNDLDQGLFLGEGDFRWISSKGNDIDLYNGTTHSRIDRIETEGFGVGELISRLFENFDFLSLGRFTAITTAAGGNEWDGEISDNCPTPSSPCASAKAGGGSQNKTIEANFTMANVSEGNISFDVVTIDYGFGGEFYATINNNSGSGEVMLFDIQGTDEDQTAVIATPTNMFNATIVSLRFYHSSSHTNKGDVFIDNVNVTGNTTASTLNNFTVRDGRIEFGTGACNIDVNGTGNTTMTIGGLGCGTVRILGNETIFINVEVQSQNVTGNITPSLNDTFFIGIPELWWAQIWSAAFALGGDLITSWTDIPDAYHDQSTNTTDNVTFAGFATGNLANNEIDLRVGIVQGAIQIGRVQMSQGTMSVGGLDLNGTFVTRYRDGNSSIRFIWTGADNRPLLAIPREGADFAMYSPRSRMIGGDLGQQFDDGIINCTAQGYNRIDCDTDASGADLGVHDDIEVRGSLFVNETIESNNWTNVTITEDQITDLQHTTNVSVFTVSIPIGHEIQGRTVYDGWIPQINMTVTQISISTQINGSQDWTLDLLKDGAEQSRTATLSANTMFNLTDIADIDFSTTERLGVRVTAAGLGALQRPAGIEATIYYFGVN